MENRSSKTSIKAVSHQLSAVSLVDLPSVGFASLQGALGSRIVPGLIADS
jgi:hypothetical protein